MFLRNIDNRLKIVSFIICKLIKKGKKMVKKILIRVVFFLILGMVFVGCNTGSTINNNESDQVINSEFYGIYNTFGNLNYNETKYEPPFNVNETSISGNGIKISGLHTSFAGNWDMNPLNPYYGDFFYIFKGNEKIGIIRIYRSSINNENGNITIYLGKEICKINGISSQYIDDMTNIYSGIIL